jgi:tetratricopeptide (TPR) repeat protein
MISYVLVMIVSLAAGQPTRASLEGPMSQTWCEQLIKRDGYSGDDGTSRKSPSCVSWPDAQRALSQHFCKQTPGPSPRWPSRQFDCVAPAPAPVPARVSAPTARTQYHSRTRTNLILPSVIARAGVRLAYASLRAPPSSRPAPGTTQPQPEAAAAPAHPAPPEQPARSAQKQFRLGSATAALVAQAHTRANDGNYGLAAATIERALRIEPDNPLLWIELGQVRMGEGNADQADGIDRKALALATGDSQAQETAWRLIAESLRVRGRNQEAAEADRHAVALALR